MCWMELQCDGMSWMLQIKFAKEALSLSLRCKNASFVYFNSFLDRGLNEGKSFLSLRFCYSLGFVTLSHKFSDGKSDLFLKDKLFIKKNEETEDLN